MNVEKFSDELEGRSERLIKPRDSWFSPKCIEVQRRVLIEGGRALNGLGAYPPTNPNQTPNTAE